MNMDEPTAASALTRVLRLCEYLDTSSTSMAGNIVPGRATPDDIRAALDGGDAWKKLETWIASAEPGGMSQEKRERILTIVPGETLDLGNGVVLHCE